MDRLIAADDGWWVLREDAVAHVPPEAVRAGALTSEALIALRDAGLRDAPTEAPFALTVLTATSCNLGCSYCFQNTTGSAAAARPSTNPYAPARIARHLLDERTTVDIVRFVSDRMTAKGFTTVRLLIFGGEPLLNPRGTLHLLKSLAELGLAGADIVTNAVLLTAPLARELAEAGLEQVQVTFDGSRAEHDRTRVDHRGHGTYDHILRNVQRAADAAPSLRWQFRINVSSTNVSSLDDLIDDLTQLRLSRPAEVYLALVDDVGVGYADALDYTSMLADRFKNLLTRAMDGGLSAPPFSNSAAGCAFCGDVGGGTGAVINADGSLYSCWETAGKPEWRVGDVVQGYASPEQIQSRWVSCDYDVTDHGSAVSTDAFYTDVNAFLLDRTYRPSRSAPAAHQI